MQLTSILFSALVVATQFSSAFAGPLPPLNVAVADSATTLEGTPVTIDVASNDFVTDVNQVSSTTIEANLAAGGDIIDYIIIILGITAQNGVAVRNVVPNGIDTITYTPNVGFTGTDTFTYAFVTPANTITRQTSNQVTVTVTVGKIPAPVAPITVGAVSTGTPASFISFPNEISTETAIAIVNGPFNIPALRGQSAASTATSQAVANGFFARLANLFN
jgi:hypothetical protein